MSNEEKGLPLRNRNNMELEITETQYRLLSFTLNAEKGETREGDGYYAFCEDENLFSIHNFESDSFVWDLINAEVLDFVSEGDTWVAFSRNDMVIDSTQFNFDLA